MRIVLLSFFLFLSLNASLEYTKFTSAQMSLVEKMNDVNASQDEIQQLLSEQSDLYERALNYTMSHKDEFIKNINLYEEEIFSLKKLMEINKRAKNEYALLRDEVKLKSYYLLRSQNIMVKNILLSLDSEDIQEYKTLLYKYTQEHKEKMEELYSKDYEDILHKATNSEILKDAQENIRDFHLLEDVSRDTMSYLYKFENRMYSLNKYSKYKLISFVIYVNENPFVKKIDNVLLEYKLSVMKLMLIFILVLFVYFFRKIVYVYIEKYILKIDSLQRYSQYILEEQKPLIEALVLVINLNMIIYVYNNFGTTKLISNIFDMIYVLLITFIIYKLINTIAKVRLSSVADSDAKMKNDLINVGIKVINFIIFIIGLLIILYYAGVNLTAVLSGLGIGGFAVAFAAKDTISNFFGTVSILVSDVFSQGDWVEVNSKEGVVVEIGLRVTTLRTFDNALIAIPNGTLANADIKNWNKRTLGRRIKMNIGVKYDSSSDDLKNAVSQIRVMLDKHPGIATQNTKHQHSSADMAKLVSKDDLEGVKKTLLVYLDSFGPSSINILIYCFSKTVVWDEWLQTKEDIMHKIMQILEQNNLEFAFPSLSVYNENKALEE